MEDIIKKLNEYLDDNIMMYANISDRRIIQGRTKEADLNSAKKYVLEGVKEYLDEICKRNNPYYFAKGKSNSCPLNIQSERELLKEQKEYLKELHRTRNCSRYIGNNRCLDTIDGVCIREGQTNPCC